ncbi:MAG: hypothetical protein JNM06_04740 [Blastocatellia bacterium]|nr:hypothetical protein [Blastocatellia bacterium]
MQNKNSDDLDFNIEEVEQVIAPQIDTGGGDIGSDDSKIDEPEEPANSGGNSFSRSRKIFCC